MTPSPKFSVQYLLRVSMNKIKGVCTVNLGIWGTIDLFAYYSRAFKNCACGMHFDVKIYRMNDSGEIS